jgi:hypothetical protein
MPKIHKYKDSSGFYIRATFVGKDTPKGKENIVTFHVTPAGEYYLKHPGCFRRPRGDGSEISRDELIWMYQRGYLTTKGTGPGLIEVLPKNKKEKRGCGCGCPLLGVLIAAPVILCISVYLWWKLVNS